MRRYIYKYENGSESIQKNEQRESGHLVTSRSRDRQLGRTCRYLKGTPPDPVNLPNKNVCQGSVLCLGVPIPALFLRASNGENRTKMKPWNTKKNGELENHCGPQIQWNTMKTFKSPKLKGVHDKQLGASEPRGVCTPAQWRGIWVSLQKQHRLSVPTSALLASVTVHGIPPYLYTWRTVQGPHWSWELSKGWETFKTSTVT